MKHIPLTKGMVAIVDDDDYDSLSAHKWSALQTPWGFYAVRGRRNEGKTTYIYMHREVLRAEKGVQVDHVNRNGIDNRKENLRVATQAQNNANMGINSINTSGFKGVGWHKAAKKWKASISHNYKSIHLGLFTDPALAAEAYDAAAKRLRGEFACTNQMLYNK